MNTAAHKNERKLIGYLLAGVAGMFGFAYLLVPLYGLLCDITGLGGRTGGRADPVAEERIAENRLITVEFIGTLNQGAPWDFKPETSRMTVHPGQFYQTTFLAKNLSNIDMVGQAVPSVAPGSAAKYFQKIECFCFNRQDFKPNEARDMPLVFRIDPDIPEQVTTVTLSYTFFRVENDG